MHKWLNVRVGGKFILKDLSFKLLFVFSFVRIHAFVYHRAQEIRKLKKKKKDELCQEYFHSIEAENH